MLSYSLRVVCLILLVSGVAYAQTAIEGTVRNAAGQPVPNASVSLRHRDGVTALTPPRTAMETFGFRAWKAERTRWSRRLRTTSKRPYEFVLRPRQPIP